MKTPPNNSAGYHQSLILFLGIRMDIFVMRHGHAEPEAKTDKDRPLSLSGIHELKIVLLKCVTEMTEVRQAYVSPYVRAQQTFEVVNDLLPDLVKTNTDAVTPNGNPHAFIDFLFSQSQHHNLQSVLVISHQPFVGTLVDTLCNLEPGSHRMGTSALAAIVSEPVAAGCGELKWLRQPL